MVPDWVTFYVVMVGAEFLTCDGDEVVGSHFNDVVPGDRLCVFFVGVRNKWADPTPG